MIVRLVLLIGVVLGIALPAQAQRCPDQLPAAAEAKRAAIVAAARARDLPALAKLAGPGDFTYSFAGDEGSPLPYWRQAMKEGIDVPRFMAAIFSMRCGVMVESGAFIFPLSSAMDWKNLRPAEKAEMEALYGRDIDQWFLEGRDKGYYVGWRGVIEKNGAWSSFVSGD